MELETWRTWDGPGLMGPQAWEYPLLLLCLALVAAAALVHRRSFLSWSRGLLLLGLLPGAVLLRRALVLVVPSSPGVRPDLYTGGPPPFTALLGALPIAVGAWLGPGPALIVGFASGLAWAAATTGGLTDSFHLAFFGFVLGILLHQEYRGRLPQVLRQPLAACPLAALAGAAVLLLSVFVRLLGQPIAGLVDALAWTAASLPPLLVESLIAGVVAQAALALFPSLRPVRSPSSVPPYDRAPRARALFAVVIVLLGLACASVSTVATRAAAVERDRALRQMAEDAEAAALGFAYFVHAGEGLLAGFSPEGASQTETQDYLEEQLRSNQHALAFFDRLALFTDGGVPVADYPGGRTPAQLTTEEHELVQVVLDTGQAQATTAHLSSEDGVVFSFLAPVDSVGASSHVVLGRARVQANPLLRAVLEGLEDPGSSREGFVVDQGRSIVLHTDSASLLQDWVPSQASVPIESSGIGQASEGRSAEGNTRELSYYLPVEESSFAIVITLPFQAIAARAAQLALPLLLLQVLASGAIAVVVYLAGSPTTHPEPEGVAEEAKTEESGGPMRSQPSGGASMTSDDLKDALVAIAEAGKTIASTPDPRDAVPPFLEAALKALGAAVARLVFPAADGTPQTVIGRGESVEGVALIDSALGAAATEPDRPIVIEDLSEQTALVGGRASQGSIRALAALSIGTPVLPAMVLWVGYTSVQRFGEADITLLRALAGQVSALFQGSQQLRATKAQALRLAAVLEQSGDGVLIADSDGQVLHINSAAAEALGLASDEVVGRDLSDIGVPPPVLKLAQDAAPDSELPTQDISLPGGRTWRFTGSSVPGPDGQSMGRAVYMRDVTDSKRMDDSRAQLVGKISHDLRTPLSLIRGYTAMFPTEGELNERQRLFLEKIMLGASQIETMLNELTELEVPNGGVPLTLRPCHLGTILNQAVESREARAAAKGLSLRLNMPEKSATVSGDADLLRQAVNHLLDNSIKYTPGGGIVAAELSVGEDSVEVSIADTGHGFPRDELARVLKAAESASPEGLTDEHQLGLGLSTVLSIVHRHGGTVSVKSETNKGSTVSFTLPLASTGGDAR
jgi:two-component system phosphate regulon sensor histidine kinase PhoR